MVQMYGSSSRAYNLLAQWPAPPSGCVRECGGAVLPSVFFRQVFGDDRVTAPGSDGFHVVQNRTNVWVGVAMFKQR